MFSFSSGSLFLALLLSGYLTALCSSPPNPNPHRAYKKDRVGGFAGRSPVIFRRSVILCFSFYHALLALTFQSPDTHICRYPSHLNAVLFTWNAHILACLILNICIGAPIRLAAYRGLGQNFTFRLSPPDQLVTTGIYRYVQHPSYTGQFIVVTANFMFLTRWDGPLACWVPANIIDKLRGWGGFVYVVIIVLMVWILSMRVKDEEAMLYETFGKSWERWQRKTKRFIPGVF
ncbi:prenyl cysteine carboxyl methyltransferase [Lipomyces kononenkoae]|uniref:Prenyl cysteine carboxyl methyltransferase n=1 Tax=Lipomyces kononenkoae TaxID=34357 RepID=A0ACC3SZY5_LIPKO